MALSLATSACFLSMIASLAACTVGFLVGPPAPPAGFDATEEAPPRALAFAPMLEEVEDVTLLTAAGFVGLLAFAFFGANLVVVGGFTDVTVSFLTPVPAVAGVTRLLASFAAAAWRWDWEGGA